MISSKTRKILDFMTFATKTRLTHTLLLSKHIVMAALTAEKRKLPSYSRINPPTTHNAHLQSLQFLSVKIDNKVAVFPCKDFDK